MSEAGTRASGEGELGRFARGGRRQELALDLRCQADRSGAVAPVVEVGEAAVGHDDVGQRVRGLLDLRQHFLAHDVEEQLQYADGVTAVGNRSEQALPRPVRLHLHQLLCTQDLVVDAAAGKGHPLGPVPL